jgi:hypothetical protein
MRRTHFLAALCVQENPPKLNDFCRIFCNVDSMLVTSRSNMYNNVSVEIALLALAGRRHLGGRMQGTRSDL